MAWIRDSPGVSRPEVRVVLISAEPEGQTLTEPTRELEAIRAAVYGGPIHFYRECVYHATRASVMFALETNQPQVVHWHSHGQQDGVFIEGHDGEPVHVEAEWLVQAITGCRKTKLVVLSACESIHLARALVASPHTRVRAAIAWAVPVDNRIARAFAAEFYRQLARGQKKVVASFERAKLTLPSKWQNEVKLLSRGQRDFWLVPRVPRWLGVLLEMLAAALVFALIVLQGPVILAWLFHPPDETAVSTPEAEPSATSTSEVEEPEQAPDAGSTSGAAAPDPKTPARVNPPDAKKQDPEKKSSPRPTPVQITPIIAAPVQPEITQAPQPKVNSDITFFCIRAEKECVDKRGTMSLATTLKTALQAAANDCKQSPPSAQVTLWIRWIGSTGKPRVTVDPPPPGPDDEPPFVKCVRGALTKVSARGSVVAAKLKFTVKSL